MFISHSRTRIMCFRGVHIMALKWIQNFYLNIVKCKYVRSDDDMNFQKSILC